MIVANRPSSFLETGDAVTALAERTHQVDGLVLEASETLLRQPGIALLAVGGYGRRHLFPYSDIDILLLFENERLAQASKETISVFLQKLWDAGMRVSQSVRTPAECAQVHDQNVELNVSLLDQRYLAGDRTLYADLARRLPKFIQAERETLVRNLARLTRERHAKFAGTFYHLEPDVKETPGGLRDYQLICWLQQINSSDQTRAGTADPAPDLQQSFRYLARLRCHLHCQAGRDNNNLTFDAQDSIAEEWHAPDPAHWMREYFRHARTVYRAAIRTLEANEGQSSSLFSQFRDWRSRLANADFSVHRDRIQFRAPQNLESDPDLSLRLFEFVARHGVRPSFDAEQRLAARLDRLRAHYAAAQPVWRVLQEILSLPHAPLALRGMHDTGLLTALFPELEQIECLVVRDFFHRYTVDEHTLVAIGNLCAIERPYRDLLEEVKNRATLLLALLFHDSGKGSPAAGHVEASRVLAEHAMLRIGTPQAERDDVLFLIARHLDLSNAMFSRDVFDPQTIRDVAHQVGTVERLKLLTLLTYADISAVNPGTMTAWRAEQLWQLYLMVYNEFTRELDAERIETDLAGPPERVDFLSGFPTRYLRTHTESEISDHMALEAQSRKRGVAVDVRRREAAWELTLIATDRPGLFAAAAGTLSSFGLNILRAEAFANRKGLILDTFTFADPNRNLDLNATEVDRLRVTLERVMAGKLDVRDLLRNRPRPRLPSRKAQVPAKVTFNSEAGTSATLVEVVAEDRPGLLYDLASALSAVGANIEVVLIDTQTHKAIDVFYVTVGGRKLDAATQATLGQALEKAVTG